MSIQPGELNSVFNADDPQSIIENNLAILTRLLYQRMPSFQAGVPVLTIGYPGTGEHIEFEYFRDVYGAEWVCVVAGTPGTWVQITPAIVDSAPLATLTGYWIIRRDLNWKQYRYTGSGFEEVFLSLDGGTMRGNLTLAADPTNSLHAATKAYVDALAGGGADPKDSCRVATTANVNLATGGLLTIDGVTLVAGNRVLVMNQTAAAENGIYVASAGGWSRASDANNSSKVTSGMYCFVTEGATMGDMGYVLTTNDPITLGTDGLTFAQFSKGLADGECTDTKIGNRSVDQSLASPADTGNLTSLLSWIVGRLKAVTGKSDWKTAPQTTLENSAVVMLNFVIDGGGGVITTGQKGFLEIPFNMTITRVTLMADQVGSAVVDIWKDSYAAFPPTGADSITAAAKPTITAAQKVQDATLTGWSTSLTAGDILAFNVDSVTTIQRLTISIVGKKT